MTMKRDDEKKVLSEKEEVTMRGGATVEPTRVEKAEAPVTREEMRELYRREPTMTPMPTWRSPTAGILEILAGAFNILVGLGAVAGTTIFASLFTVTLPQIGVGVGVLLILLGIVSIIGGSFALNRRAWGWALAGAITALFFTPAIFLGILALIFITLGKPEFK